MDQENSKLLLMDQLDFTTGKLKEFEIQEIESRLVQSGTFVHLINFIIEKLLMSLNSQSESILLRYADGFTPKYEVYFTACIPARLNDKDRLEDMNHILENVDGIHLDTISIESSYRKTQEGKHDRKNNRNP